VPDRDEIDAARTDQPEWPTGWYVRHVDEVGSTNTELARAAAAGAPDRSVLVTDHQLAGRGRLDRTWEAPPGANLLASVMLRDLSRGPYDPVQRLSLAAVAACEQVAGVRPVLKWPNDLLLGDGKLAGVLAEAGPRHVVVGIGLNVGWAPPGAALLGAGIRPLTVLAAMLRVYDEVPPDLTVRYRADLATLGRRVRAELPGRASVEGIAVDVDADGGLVIDSGGTLHTVTAGDIVHLRAV